MIVQVITIFGAINASSEQIFGGLLLENFTVLLLVVCRNVPRGFPSGSTPRSFSTLSNTEPVTEAIRGFLVNEQ